MFPRVVVLSDSDSDSATPHEQPSLRDAVRRLRQRCGRGDGAGHLYCVHRSDAGHGCAWRALQTMLSSVPRFNGGAPTLACLERALEAAWRAGFDPAGAAHFASRCVGRRRWIGPTDGAALLRWMGIGACVVDFDGAGAEAVVRWCRAHFGSGGAGGAGGSGGGARLAETKRRRAGDTSDNAIEIYDTDDSDEWALGGVVRVVETGGQGCGAICDARSNDADGDDGGVAQPAGWKHATGGGTESRGEGGVAAVVRVDGAFGQEASEASRAEEKSGGSGTVGEARSSMPRPPVMLCYQGHVVCVVATDGDALVVLDSSVCETALGEALRRGEESERDRSWCRYARWTASDPRIARHSQHQILMVDTTGELRGSLDKIVDAYELVKGGSDGGGGHRKQGNARKKAKVT